MTGRWQRATDEPESGFRSGSELDDPLGPELDAIWTISIISGV